MLSSERAARLAKSAEQHRDWYDRAWESVHAWASERGHDPRRVVDILAITSPRVHVSRNVRICKAYVTGEPDALQGVLPQVIRGLEIYEEQGVIHGRKTGPFAAAIQGDPDAVVIDVWYARAFIGAARARACDRRAIVKRTHAAARALGWQARQVQAAVWAVTLYSHGRKTIPYLEF